MPSGRPLPSVILLITAVLALICPGKPQEDGRIATFYGGHVRFRLRSEDRDLQVSLRFKTSLDSGLMSVVRYKDNSGYLAIGAANGQLQAIVKHNNHSQTLVVAPISSDWNNLTIQLHNSTLKIALGSSEAIYHSPLSVSLRDVYFGGAHNFFAPVFTDLNLTDFFVGCIAHVSVNNESILFASGYGIELGCCPNPRPIAWCFDSTNSFMLTTALSHQRFSTSLEISFRIQTSRIGTVFHSDIDSHNILIEVDNDSVVLTVNNTWSLRCAQIYDKSAWHRVHLAISTSSLYCQVDEMASSTAFVDLPSLPKRLAAEIGSFEGCIKRLQFNSIDVTLGNIPPNTSNFAGACPPTEPPECSFPENVQWGEFQVVTTPVNLTEGDTVTITSGRTPPTPSGNIDVFIPVSVIEKQTVENALSFYVMEGPGYGYFARAPNRKITSFSYQELKDGLVFYRHNGAESKADAAILEARVLCRDTAIHTVQAVLNFTIELTNDRPKVARVQELSVAVGTRTVITDKVITVTDEETDLENIVFEVERIEACTPWCGGEPAGQIERLNDDSGQKHKRFTQEDVNLGLILFQHFPEFGTAPVNISFIVSDRSSNRIPGTIQVHPYEGIITLTANECLYVVEGSTLLLQPRRLSATTDFEDQNPTLTYDVLQLPRHGRLERPDRPQNESLMPLWVPISEIPKTKDSFTQTDVDSGLIRYVHDNSTQPVAANDSFHFQLRSTNLTGPEDDFCIRVVSYLDLDKPSISAEVGTIRVREGGEISINESLLHVNISLSPPILIDWLEEEIGIDLLGATFIIPPTQVPSYGKLLVGGSELLNDSFTISDIRSGALTYTHSNSEEHIDSFAFYVEARKTLELPIRPPDPTSIMNATIVVTPVNNHVPEILQMEYVSPPEGGWIAVTPEMLKVVDADLPGDVLTITVCSNDPNGYFAVSTPEVTRSRTTIFSMDDVNRGRIVFVHELGASLSHSLSVKVEDGIHTVNGSVQIEVIPLKIIVAPVSLPNKTCVAQLDAAVEPPVVTLNWNIISLEIDDPHGNDMNRCHDIIVRVVAPPTYGELRRTVNGSTTVVSQFQALDLKHSRIEYFFKNRLERAQNDAFQLEFTLGFSSSGPVPFSICINPIPVPVQKVVKDISVARGGMNVINNSHLLYASSRIEDPESSLVYELLAPPKLGCIFNHSRDDCSEQLLNFTQEDINNGHIAYSHTKQQSAELHDYFAYRVCTAFNCTAAFNFSISLYASRLHIINNGFTVIEGEGHVISASELYAIVPAGYYVEFLVVQGPMRGQLNRIVSGSDTLEEIDSFEPKHVRSGSVQYVNSGTEHQRDSFKFKAVVKTTDSPPGVILDSADRTFSGVVSISITDVNDNPPIRYINTELRVIEGSRTRLDNNSLSYHDSDSSSSDVDLVYTIAYPFSFLPAGTLYLESNPDVRVQTWTEGDLRNGRLYYRETGSRLLDQFPFSVSDGKRDALDNFVITVISIDFVFDALPFELDEGDTEGISQNYLQYFAANDKTLEDADFRYTITRPPNHGRLLFQGEDATVFTQLELLGNNLVYKHDDSNTEKDSFEFTISVPSRNADSDQEFNIIIQPIDDDPPEVMFIQDPIFMVEMSRLHLSSDHITISDEDSNIVVLRISVVATIMQPPKCGFIEVNPFGALEFEKRTTFNLVELDRDEVHYNHTMRGHWSDSFIFKVADGSNNVQAMASQVNITILPLVISLNVTGVSIREGGEVVLQPENFVVDHPYLRHAPGVVIIVEPPSHGNVINKNINGSVAQFTTEELADGSIVYRHSGDEDETDHFVFLYNNTEPVDFARTSNPANFSIEIILFNDEIPVLTIAEEPLFVWYRETVVLDSSILSAVDEDNTPEELRYTVSVSSGHIAYLGAERVPIGSFTQAEVDAKQVVFIHSSGDGVMNCTVSDGNHMDKGLIRIEAEPLMLRRVNNSPLTVDMGERKVIEVEHLSFITNDNRSAEPREITFEVTSIEYGKIVVGSTETTQFTQRDISAGRVAYVHTDTDIWEPSASLMLHVNTPLAVNSISVLFMVNISHPSSSYSELAANEPIRIEEGSTVCLDQSILDARNLRYNTWKENMNNYDLSDVSVVFKLDRPAPHGSVEIGGDQGLCFTQEQIASGLVCYKHNGSLETQSDRLDFRVDILAGGTALASFHSAINISIILINDEEPQLWSPSLRKNAVKGFTILIESSDLQVLDADNPPDEIIYTVLQEPTNGHLMILEIPLTNGSSFTQADIDDGRLMFEPVKLGDSQFVFTFSDGSDVGTNDGVNFTITVEKHTLEVKKQVVTFQQNVSRAVITRDFLDTCTNGRREDTWFNMTVPPLNGRLTDNLEDTLTNFTQVTVDEKLVFYVLTNLDAHNDSFEIQVCNEELCIWEVVTIPIRVLVLGQVKEDITLDLRSNSSSPLPADMLDLSYLQRAIRIPPRIEVLHPPRYGYLEKIFNGYKFPRADYFNYAELQDGWIHYTWNFSVPSEPATTQMESFTVVVKDPTGAEIEQPGEAEIIMRVYPPKTPYTTTPPTATTRETLKSEEATEPPFTDSPAPNEGFPMYALVPIIGIFVVLVIIVVVVIVFCITQQKRIRRKWRRSKASSTTYPYPWSAQPNTIAPTAHANYSFNLATPPSEEEDGDSEVVSVGYSEDPPITRHSSARSHPRSSPFYTNSPTPRSRIGRIRSNVSISLSNRIASDVSLEDSSHRHRLSPLYQHPPAHLVVPLAVRPPLIRRNSRDGGESGYLSAQHRSTDTSACSVTRNQDRMNVVTPYSETDTLPSVDESTSKSPLPPPTITAILTANGTKPQNWSLQQESTVADPDASPDMRKLFRSTNPVLKKQEYWV